MIAATKSEVRQCIYVPQNCQRLRNNSREQNITKIYVIVTNIFNIGGVQLGGRCIVWTVWFSRKCLRRAKPIMCLGTIEMQIDVEAKWHKYASVI